MERLVVTVVLGLLTVAVVVAVQRRRRSAAPVEVRTWNVPALLQRDDFDRPAASWLVAVFTSATCDVCAEVWRRASVLGTEDGAVVCQEVEAVRDRRLHERYRIDAVPLVLIADGDGTVQRHFLGPVRAPDLWGALAELRDPGSVPPGCDAHG